MGLEHFLNADFDLSLRPRWRPPTGETSSHRITDLAWHALFLAGPGDSVLIGEDVPEDFVDYLERSGLSAPTLTIEPDVGGDQLLSPFGWNRDAASRNHRYDVPALHPSIETVTLVNGRRFSARLEGELFDDDHIVAELSDEQELHRRLSQLSTPSPGWVLKAEHGNAGLGNRRLLTNTLSDGDLKAVRRIFAEDDVAILERWRPRLRDLCATFAVRDNGTADNFGLHETVTTADGALIGSLFQEDPKALAEWRRPMAEAAAAVASRLAASGYAGPACIDAFVWDDDGRQRLRPLVEINARREISAGASNLWRRLGAGAAYWRFYTRRKLRLPDSYPALEEALGTDSYDPSRRRGTLITAPLRLGPGRRSPAKTALLFLGGDRDEVLAMDRHFRRRFER